MATETGFAVGIMLVITAGHYRRIIISAPAHNANAGKACQLLFIGTTLIESAGWRWPGAFVFSPSRANCLGKWSWFFVYLSAIVSNPCLQSTQISICFFSYYTRPQHSFLPLFKGNSMFLFYSEEIKSDFVDNKLETF